MMKQACLVRGYITQTTRGKPGGGAASAGKSAAETRMTNCIAVRAAVGTTWRVRRWKHD